MKIRLLEGSRYYVTLDGGEYLVDLDEFGGNGFCGCKHFQYIYLPVLEVIQDSGEPLKEFFRCKHIRTLVKHLSASNPTTESATPQKEVNEGREIKDDRKTGCYWHHVHYGDFDNQYGEPATEREINTRICCACPAKDTCTNEARTIHKG